MRMCVCVFVCVCSMRWTRQQKHLKRLLTRAARASGRHAKQAQARLDRLSFVQPDQLRTLHDLGKDFSALYAGASTLPPLDPSTNADVLLPRLEPGKREWETSKAGYLNWATSRLIQRTQRAPGGPVVPGGTSAEDATATASKEDMAAALRELERDDE